jgi:putative ABC transport system permease protein
MQLPERGRAGFEILAGDGATLWQAFEQGAALVSEPLATRLALGVGDVLQLPTAQGPRDFPIAAIYRDYSSPQGVVSLSLPHYQQAFGDAAIGAMGLFATPEAAGPLAESLRALAADDPTLQVVTAAEIRAISLEVFARTFAITDILRLLAGLIAVVAVLGALSALAIERQREFALLRAIGLAPAQLKRLQLMQGGTLGLLAGLCALPLGLGLAVLLIEVINRRSFGWSMQLDLPWGQILAALGISTLAAVLAAWWPARRAAGMALVQQLRGSGP